ncbi:erg10, acetyl-CoA C-acetyltransferase [Rhizophlyctis rosea]|nr:erg10, acetyl-CoA C-acetyltransferase [Rhizophlyctis rosea]
MGNVISAGVGQAPARQAAIKAGLPYSTEATTINKVCASGMKAIIFAAQSLQLGHRSIMVAGGMESMSNVPFYFPRGARTYALLPKTPQALALKLPTLQSLIHMGTCAEETAAEYGITREEQDKHAIESYRRAGEAWKSGLFKSEIVPVTIKDKKGEKVVNEDDEYRNIQLDKIPKLSGAFQKGGMENCRVQHVGKTKKEAYLSTPPHATSHPHPTGTVTAANSSTLNDGGSALLLTTARKAKELSLNPIARIISFGDAATEPKKFTIAPSLAIPIALERAGVREEDVELFEINEAFSVVVRANEKILGLDPEKVNKLGGAVALGHPIGSSASRIVVSLTHALKPGQIGVAAVCNGGGAASALTIERL